MRRRVLVTGCSPPSSSPRPGSVTSMRSATSFLSMSVRVIASRRAMIATSRSPRALCTPATASGPSLATSLPADFRSSVMRPFLPSQRTRASSSAVRSPHAATSSSACRIMTVRSAKTDPLRSVDAESGLCLLRDRAERRSVVHRDVREHLAVDFDAGLVQAVDDAAVGEPVQARRGVDARDPQCAELTLVLPPVAVRVLACLDDGLLGRAIDLAPGVVVTLGLGENLLVTASGRHATLHSCHGSARLLVIREELLETANIAVVHETRAAGARVAFDLAGLVAEIVAPVGRVALEALRRLAKALGRGPVGFQLGHRNHSSLCSPVRQVLAHPLRANAPQALRPV